MSNSMVNLVPFAEPAPAVELSAGLEVVAAQPHGGAQGGDSSWLQLRFKLLNLPGQAGIENLRLIPPGSRGGEPRGGQRLDGLWEHTCLECFLSPAGASGYLEFNLAPDGAWNVYSLDGYRQGLRPAPNFPRLPFRCEQRSDGLELELQCQLPPAWAGQELFDWQLSAVLQQQDGQLSYWAVRHPAEAADFHDRSCWTLSSRL